MRHNSLGAAMHANAALTCEKVGSVNRLTRLRSEGQLMLRPTIPTKFEPWAHGDPTVGRVSVSAGAAGPLGGDRLTLDVHVGAGASLVLAEISATLALPGTRGGQSKMTFTVHVEEGGTLIWMPEPVIAAHNCDHRQTIRISLATTARLFFWESLIIGRHNEDPGNIQQDIRVTRSGAPLFHQNLRLGPRYQGWDGPAVAGSNRAAGNMLVVDPGTLIGVGRSDIINSGAISVGIAPDAVQTSVVAPNNLAVTDSFDEALRRLGSPWSKQTGPEQSAVHPHLIPEPL